MRRPSLPLALSRLTFTSAGIINGWSVTGEFDGEFANRLQSYAGTGILRYVW